MTKIQDVKVEAVCEAIRDCVKERDTYRDLCAELLDALLAQDQLSKKGLLGAGFGEIDKVRELRKSAIIKANSILGEDK